jgi:hypothetical protein
MWEVDGVNVGGGWWGRWALLSALPVPFCELCNAGVAPLSSGQRCQVTYPYHNIAGSEARDKFAILEARHLNEIAQRVAKYVKRLCDH